VFTAGNDLADFAAANRGEPDAARTGGNPLLIALARATTPLVAAVNGRAVGVGTTMLLHCDLVFVSDDALLTTPFVNLALIPEAASSLLLPARIGHARAFSMFVLGGGGGREEGGRLGHRERRVSTHRVAGAGPRRRRRDRRQAAIGGQAHQDVDARFRPPWPPAWRSMGSISPRS